MITIMVNGQKENIADRLTVQAFILARSLDPDAVVVEYNRKILPTAALKTTELKANDRLELLNFVGGG